MTAVRTIAKFNRDFNNRVQSLWAPRVPPYLVVVHRGRKSGSTYRTPVTAWVSGNKMTVILYYGADTDWVRNVIAANGSAAVRAGRKMTITNPRIVDTDSPELSRFARTISLRARKALVADIT